MFIYIGLEEYVPSTYPLRRVRTHVDPMRKEMDPEFQTLYTDVSRPSIPPGQLPRSLVLLILYSIRIERVLAEQLLYNLLFKWFVRLQIDEKVRSATTCTKNRDRHLGERVARISLGITVKEAKKKRPLSDEHFTVDGTLVESYASLKSFPPKDKSDKDPEDCHRKKRENDTHEPVTDPEAKLYCKGNGKEARLYCFDHVFIENRNGLVCYVELSSAHGTAETENAGKMLTRVAERIRRRRTCGADEACDTRPFVRKVREHRFALHVARNNSGGNGDCSGLQHHEDSEPGGGAWKALSNPMVRNCPRPSGMQGTFLLSTNTERRKWGPDAAADRRSKE